MKPQEMNAQNSNHCLWNSAIHTWGNECTVEQQSLFLQIETVLSIHEAMNVKYNSSHWLNKCGKALPLHEVMNEWKNSSHCFYKCKTVLPIHKWKHRRTAVMALIQANAIAYFLVVIKDSSDFLECLCPRRQLLILVMITVLSFLFLTYPVELIPWKHQHQSRRKST